MSIIAHQTLAKTLGLATNSLVATNVFVIPIMKALTVKRVSKDHFVDLSHNFK